jgi:hypothetical protein
LSWFGKNHAFLAHQIRWRKVALSGHRPSFPVDEINVVSIAQFRAIAPSARETDFRWRCRAVPAANARQHATRSAFQLCHKRHARNRYRSPSASVFRPAARCPASPATIISIAVWLSKVSLGVVEATSNDPRVQRDHRGGGKHDYVFHSFSWLICCGELLKNPRSATAAGAISDVTPKIAARCSRALYRLIEHAPQPRKA